MQPLLIELWQNLWYGVLKHKPAIDFSEIPETIKFTSHYDAAHDVHWLQVSDLPEFIVSGKTPEELARNFIDTLLVYFDVPVYFAKRFKSDAMFNFINQKTQKQETITLRYKEQLSKALA